MIHRPGTVEAGMLSGVSDQRENLLCRRFDDPFHADAVSLHAPTIASRQRVNRPAGRRCATALRRVRFVPRAHARAARWCRSRTPRPDSFRHRRPCAAVSGRAWRPFAHSAIGRPQHAMTGSARSLCRSAPAPAAAAAARRACACRSLRAPGARQRRRRRPQCVGDPLPEKGPVASPAGPQWAMSALCVGPTAGPIGTRTCRPAAARSRPQAKPMGPPVPGLHVGLCEEKAPARGSGMLS